MPFTIRPYRRFPVQCSMMYSVGRQGLTERV